MGDISAYVSEPSSQYLADLKAYLGSSASQYSDTTLTGAINTEMASQANRCTVKAIAIQNQDGTTSTAVPADIYEALMRRCQANLARLSLPLGVTTGSGDGDSGIPFLPNLDPEVRRLEAPYRRLTVG